MLSTLFSVEGLLANAKLGVPATSSRHAVTVMSDLAWSPSSRGEAGKTARDEAFGPLQQYCANLNGVERRTTRTCEAGPVKFGSEHPIVRQTMATTLTPYNNVLNPGARVRRLEGNEGRKKSGLTPASFPRHIADLGLQSHAPRFGAGSLPEQRLMLQPCGCAAFDSHAQISAALLSGGGAVRAGRFRHCAGFSGTGFEAVVAGG